MVGFSGAGFEEGGDGDPEALVTEFGCFFIPFFELAQVGVEDDVSVLYGFEDPWFDIVTSTGGHPEVSRENAGHDDGGLCAFDDSYLFVFWGFDELMFSV